MMGDIGLVRDFAIIMATAGVALVILRRLRQPPILGYLIAGIIVGPFIVRGRSVEDAGVIRRLADLGLVLLLFGIGLEFGWQRIRRVGFQVVLIGLVEMLFMLAIGYRLGRAFGWNGTEAVFLGAALSISSSAILSKMLRDSGRLHQVQGRLMVGVLVVEDFVAVVLLAVLSGVATTGAADARDVGLLMGRLIVFTVSALVLGALVAPRLIGFLARQYSQETLLIAGLALCFGLALVAQQLGVSAAAGAFLIGAVLGDTEHSDQMLGIMGPVRDMFGALFFVSVGMLVDVMALAHYIGPALIVSAVFIAGKVAINSAATFMVGHDTRTSLRVGAGMPQVGEFSLAMVKSGVDAGAVGGIVYSVVAATTALTTLAYPFVFRSADMIERVLERRTPRLFRHYIEHLSVWLTTMRGTFSFKSEEARRVQRAGKLLLVNIGIIMVVVAAATFTVSFADQILRYVPLSERVFDLLTAAAVLVLCVPPAIAIWRLLHSVADGVAYHVLEGPGGITRAWARAEVRVVLRETLAIAVVLFFSVWSLPFLIKLFALGRFAAPLPAVALTVMLAVGLRAAFRVYGTLESAFARTFLSDGQSAQERRGGEPQSRRD